MSDAPFFPVLAAHDEQAVGQLVAASAPAVPLVAFRPPDHQPDDSQECEQRAAEPGPECVPHAPAQAENRLQGPRHNQSLAWYRPVPGS